MGYLALTVMCYNDSGGGAIWKAGDQYPPMKIRVVNCLTWEHSKTALYAAYDKAFESY